jgi:nicotinate-nucleotide pyrophosphorylase (carboxylating)
MDVARITTANNAVEIRFLHADCLWDPMTMAAPSLAHILPSNWESQVIVWLKEDAPSFDWGGYVVGDVEREAFLLGKGKSPAVLAGVPFVDAIFSYLGCQ